MQGVVVRFAVRVARSEGGEATTEVALDGADLLPSLVVGANELAVIHAGEEPLALVEIGRAALEPLDEVKFLPDFGGSTLRLIHHEGGKFGQPGAHGVPGLLFLHLVIHRFHTDIVSLNGLQHEGA